MFSPSIDGKIGEMVVIATADDRAVKPMAATEPTQIGAMQHAAAKFIGSGFLLGRQ